MTQVRFRNRSWSIFALGLSLSSACSNPAPDSEILANTAGACAHDKPDTGLERTDVQTARESRPVLAAAHCEREVAARCDDNPNGVFGVRFDLDVYWSDEMNASSPLFDPGRGTITLYARAQIRDVDAGGDGRAEMRLCGMRLPPLFADTNGTVTQLIAPDALWDSPEIPSTAGSVQSAERDPALLTTSPIMQTIGIELSENDAAWPTFDQTPFVTCPNGEGEDCFPDEDSDGRPGITVWTRLGGPLPDAPYLRAGGWHYDALPTEPGVQYPGGGASAIYLGLRTTLATSLATGKNCARAPAEAQAHDITLRALDCVTQQGPCTVTGATFVDRNLPSFRVLQPGEAPPPSWKHLRREADQNLNRDPSSGPLSRSVRLSDDTDPIGCSEVRCALPDRAGTL